MKQSSSWGNPQPTKNYRFIRMVGALMGRFIKYMRVIAIVLAIMALIQLIYVGVFVKHTEVYISDGTIFSCRIETNSMVRVNK